MKAIIAIALLASTAISCAQQAAPPRDISVSLSPEDQKNFKEVCAMAMRNPAIGTDMT